MGKIATRAGIATLAFLALAVTSCASQKATGDGSGSADGDGVKTGPGVTDTTITVSILTDFTGPYASLGKSLTQAQQLYFEQVNAAGGVCGRKYEVVVRDHGYDTQKAMAAYTELAPRSAAIPQFIGSPMVTALKQRIEDDKLLTIPMAWATSLLGARAIQVTGTTYDLDMINGVSFLVEEKGIKKGDKIGHLYFEGDYGESSLNGSKYAAEKLGLEIVEQKIKATDQDMSAQVAAFKAAGVKAILVSVGPRQAASLVGGAAQAGLNVPFVGSNSSYAPQLLGLPVKDALLKNFYIMTAGAPISMKLPVMEKLAADYRAKYPDDTLDNSIPSGWSAAMIVDTAIKKACEAKDLTREGILNAHRSQTTFDPGLGTPMDFTSPSRPASRASYVLKPDEKALGGTVVLKEPFVSELAEGYEVPVG
ncbi:ABC transporter substrate-binding protein [Thermobispora bispora]|uniref:ABC transporter substrate-binding protein n=1 Tax=Thermobispora bispora TaxID=2006 RepID=UPI00197F316C|nr:ABC transporter substrate-binding protein [Thermobispora bispora]QSI48022.1 ABC transporter substrate-binding protein [Thermobispora bispora]